MSWRSAALLVAIFHASPAFGYPKNCLEIQLANAYASDGEYTIEPRPGVVFKVYCNAMSRWWPTEYLPLVNTGGDFNFGQYTAGGVCSGTTVRTSFTKVRIDPATLLVDIGDMTFATSTGELGVVTPCNGHIVASPLGVALDCVGGSSATGRANIDLTGTPFQVSQTFFAHGWNPAGFVSVDGGPEIRVRGGYPPSGADVVVTGKVVNVRGGGYCGSAGPYGFNSSHAFWLVPRQGMLALQLAYVGQ